MRFIVYAPPFFHFLSPATFSIGNRIKIICRFTSTFLSILMNESNKFFVFIFSLLIKIPYSTHPIRAKSQSKNGLRWRRQLSLISMGKRDSRTRSNAYKSNFTWRMLCILSGGNEHQIEKWFYCTMHRNGIVQMLVLSVIRQKLYAPFDVDIVGDKVRKMNWKPRRWNGTWNHCTNITTINAIIFQRLWWNACLLQWQNDAPHAR